jgi:hypothetical protein
MGKFSLVIIFQPVFLKANLVANLQIRDNVYPIYPFYGDSRENQSRNGIEISNLSQFTFLEWCTGLVNAQISQML